MEEDKDLNRPEMIYIGADTHTLENFINLSASGLSADLLSIYGLMMYLIILVTLKTNAEINENRHI